MVFANQQCSRTCERLPVMPLLNRVDALNEDRLGKGASNFAMLLTRASRTSTPNVGRGSVFAF